MLFPTLLTSTILFLLLPVSRCGYPTSPDDLDADKMKLIQLVYAAVMPEDRPAVLEDGTLSRRLISLASRSFPTTNMNTGMFNRQELYRAPMYSAAELRDFVTEFLELLYGFNPMNVMDKYETSEFTSENPCGMMTSSHANASFHYNDVIMSALVSQITSPTILYSTVYARRRSKKTPKLRVTGLCVCVIHRRPVNSPLKGPITRKIIPFDGIIMHRCIPRTKVD